MMKIVMLIYLYLYKEFSTKSETGGLCLRKLFFRSFLFLIMMMGENVNIDAKKKTILILKAYIVILQSENYHIDICRIRLMPITIMLMVMIRYIDGE